MRSALKRVVTFADDNADPAGANRRNVLMHAGASAGILAAGMVLNAASPAKAATATRGGRTQLRKSRLGKGLSSAFWPDGIQMVISISMQFEAGGQPSKGTDSPFPNVELPPNVTADAAANTWFAYGYREGIPRMLDLWDRHGVKVTSHMVGEAAQHHPKLAKEIVERGHEASGHGPRWSSQYAMRREEERQFLIAARAMVEAATGQRPVGYNCNWLRCGPNTLSLLQELGYLYHIDDISRDEPFIEQVNGKDFVVVPYTLRNNDILLIEGRNYSPSKFLEQIKLDFEQLLRRGPPPPHDGGERARPHQRHATDGAGLGRVPPLRQKPAGSGAPAQG
jgi:peptidoglycan/xylan/chitin deacetylase (PgdA/CDA1 family)